MLNWFFGSLILIVFVIVFCALFGFILFVSFPQFATGSTGGGGVAQQPLVSQPLQLFQGSELRAAAQSTTTSVLARAPIVVGNAEHTNGQESGTDGVVDQRSQRLGHIRHRIHQRQHSFSSPEKEPDTNTDTNTGGEGEVGLEWSPMDQDTEGASDANDPRWWNQYRQRSSVVEERIRRRNRQLHSAELIRTLPAIPE